MASEQNASKTLRYGSHCLAFLDILGQSGKLRQLSPTPTDDPDTRKLIMETAFYVLKLRERFQGCFESAKKSTPLTDLLQDDIRNQLARGRESIRCRGFSDSFVISVSFTTEEERLASIVAVHNCMAACCLFQLSTLCYRQPIRGGIEVGLGVDLGENEIYGPVLDRAYGLEKKADYPRILVGETLWGYLEALEKIPSKTQIDRNIQLIAAQAKRLVAVDTDGLRMLDFLGRAISDLSKPDARKGLFSQAYDYIKDQIQAAEERHDDKHLGRYVKLGDYFDRSDQIWNRTALLPPNWR